MLHYDEKTGKVYRLQRSPNGGFQYILAPAKAQIQAHAPTASLPTPPATAGGMFDDRTLDRIVQKLLGALGRHSSGIPVIDGSEGYKDCDPRGPILTPQKDGCDDGSVVCNESLPIGPVTIPFGTTVPVSIVPFESFTPKLFMYSGGTSLRITSIFIKGKNQLGANQQFNPNNYTSLANYNTINWRTIYAAIPVTLNIINPSLADEVFEAEIKGPSLR